MGIVLLEIPLVEPPTVSRLQMMMTTLVQRMITPRPESTFHPWLVLHQAEDQLNANREDTGLAS
jgi:hypothetical protein